MIKYNFRRARKKDIPFLAEIVIEAEKSNSNKLSYSTLFNISQKTAYKWIIKMFEAEIDYCEFSVSSFLVVEADGQLIGGFGGWIESFSDNIPSKILKSNLILSTFSNKSIVYLKNKSQTIRNIIIEREAMTLQLEYLFICEEHRGKNITDKLINIHINNEKRKLPDLKKVQVQVFKNNIGAIKTYKKNGFKVKKSYKSNSKEILNYLPFGEKYLMEKHIN